MSIFIKNHYDKIKNTSGQFWEITREGFQSLINTGNVGLYFSQLDISLQNFFLIIFIKYLRVSESIILVFSQLTDNFVFSIREYYIDRL